MSSRLSLPNLRALSMLVLGLLFLAGCTQTQTTPKKEYSFWPPYPQPPHVQFLVAFNSSDDVMPRKSKFDELLYGRQDQPKMLINKAYGVRLVNGCIYACDVKGGTVSVFDLRKHEVRLLGTSGQGQLSRPVDIAVAPDGMKYVADTQRHAVYVYDAKDEFVGIFGADMQPISLALYGEELFVSDFKANRIKVFERHTGQLLRSMGETGSKEGQLSGVFGLTIDAKGDLWIDEVVGCRVQKFSRDGKFLKSLGSLGDRPGTFTRPKHLAVDSTGIVYVVDAAFQNVQMFNDQGECLMFFGSPGEYPGAMDMPVGICVSDTDLDLFAPYIHPDFKAERLVIVANQFGDSRLAVYALGQLREGKAVADLATSHVAIPLGAFDDKNPRDVTTSRPADLPPTTGPAPSLTSGPTTGPAPTSAPAPVAPVN